MSPLRAHAITLTGERVVLRVRQPDGLVSRPRLLAQQAVRRQLSEQRLRAPSPLSLWERVALPEPHVPL